MRCARWLVLCFGMVLAVPSAQAGSVPLVFGGDRDTHRISVRATPGIRSMEQLPDLYLRNARERLHDGGSLPDAALRQLARLNDGLAAQRYVRRLLRRPNAQPSDIAYYSAIAVGTGRVSGLPRMIAAMDQLTPGKEPQGRLSKYIQVLYAHAWAGNELALEAVISFNGEGRLFGPLSDATRQKILAQAARIGDGRVELRLAMRLLEDRPLSEAQTKWVHTYLDLAAASGHPGIAAAAMAMREMTGETLDPGG